MDHPLRGTSRILSRLRLAGVMMITTRGGACGFGPELAGGLAGYGSSITLGTAGRWRDALRAGVLALRSFRAGCHGSVLRTHHRIGGGCRDILFTLLRSGLLPAMAMLGIAVPATAMCAPLLFLAVRACR